jgi:hypothetical protein
MEKDVPRMMEQVALALAEEYTKWMESTGYLYKPDDGVLSLQAYVRARILNEIEPATIYALDYAGSNGGM